jgi:hypothetical protein
VRPRTARRPTHPYVPQRRGVRTERAQRYAGASGAAVSRRLDRLISVHIDDTHNQTDLDHEFPISVPDCRYVRSYFHSMDFDQSHTSSPRQIQPSTKVVIFQV